MYTAVEPRKLSHAAVCKAFQGVSIGGLSSIRTTDINDVIATSLKIPELLISWNPTKTDTQIQQGLLTRQTIQTTHEISGMFTELCSTVTIFVSVPLAKKTFLVWLVPRLRISKLA